MIIAVDFDGILCKNAFPKIGEADFDVIKLVRDLKEAGHEVILWTTRNGDELDAAVKWCGTKGLSFDAINAPAPTNKAEYEGVYPVESRKVYANMYIDDHNPNFVFNEMVGGRSFAVCCMISMVRKVAGLDG